MPANHILSSPQTLPAQQGFLIAVAIEWDDCVQAIAAVTQNDSPPDIWKPYQDEHKQVWWGCASTGMHLRQGRPADGMSFQITHCEVLDTTSLGHRHVGLRRLHSHACDPSPPCRIHA